MSLSHPVLADLDGLESTGNNAGSLRECSSVPKGLQPVQSAPMLIGAKPRMYRGICDNIRVQSPHAQRLVSMRTESLRHGSLENHSQTKNNSALRERLRAKAVWPFAPMPRLLIEVRRLLRLSFSYFLLW